MGADLIGWRDCPLQRELGEVGFLGKLKLRAYRGAVETQVPPEKRDVVTIRVRVTGRPDRMLRYADICAEIESFARGIPECAACPLAGGRPLGCYRYVTYPVDAVSEELLFEFFASQVDVPDSIADQLYRDIVSQVDEESSWYGGRGTEPGACAARDEPLAVEWEDAGGSHEADSAQLLAALFIPLDSPPLVAAYARFFHEFLTYVEARLREAGFADGGPDTVELRVPPGEDVAAAAETAGDALALARAVADSRTLAELREYADLLVAILPGIFDGWRVVADA